jgi:hypothetical protein
MTGPETEEVKDRGGEERSDQEKGGEKDVDGDGGIRSRQRQAEPQEKGEGKWTREGRPKDEISPGGKTGIADGSKRQKWREEERTGQETGNERQQAPGASAMSQS